MGKRILQNQKFSALSLRIRNTHKAVVAIQKDRVLVLSL